MESGIDPKVLAMMLYGGSPLLPDSAATNQAAANQNPAIAQTSPGQAQAAASPAIARADGGTVQVGSAVVPRPPGVIAAMQRLSQPAAIPEVPAAGPMPAYTAPPLPSLEAAATCRVISIGTRCGSSFRRRVTHQRLGLLLRWCLARQGRK